MSQLIVALDTGNPEHALELAGKLGEYVKWFKVGLELFVNAGPRIIEILKNGIGDARVFLDLKFYDIPATAAAAARSATRIGADMLTIHCQGGERMCREVMDAVNSAGQNHPVVVGVTALTSFGPQEMPGINMPPGEFGMSLARMADDWGLNGVVCSAREAGSIKAACPGLTLVCPGIRPTGARADDQQRIMTPAQAVKAGADFLVVGRPITGAKNPVQAVHAILEEMKRDI